jgi:hypothetical protein
MAVTVCLCALHAAAQSSDASAERQAAIAVPLVRVLPQPVPFSIAVPSMSNGAALSPKALRQFEELAQARTSLAASQEVIFAQDTALSVLTGYPLQVRSWLKAATNRPAGLTNAVLSEKIMRLYTPIVVAELLEDPQWGPIVRNTISDTKHQQYFVFTSDALLRMRQQSDIPITDAIAIRSGAAQRELLSLAEENEITGSILEYLKLWRMATVASDVAETYVSERTPMSVKLLKQKVTALEGKLRR